MQQGGEKLNFCDDCSIPSHNVAAVVFRTRWKVSGNNGVVFLGSGSTELNTLHIRCPGKHE